MNKIIIKFCKCGCGKTIKSHYDYRTKKYTEYCVGHFIKNKNNNPMYNKHHTRTTKNKISKSNTGKHRSKNVRRKMSKSRKGKKNGMWGKKQSEKTKKLIGIKSKGRIPNEKSRRKMSKAKKGKKSPFWKGGIDKINKKISMQIRDLFEYKLWRSKIFERDGWICQTCSKRGGDLEAHHIFPFIKIITKYKITSIKKALSCKELWNINNGVTLCYNCHKLIKSI